MNPPRLLPIGTILTIRMQGHTRTNGVEYFAPAIVLYQYDDMFGSIEAIVFDASAGTHYQHAYHIRDVSTRGIDNELYELRSNIGDILFAPDDFARLADRVSRLESAAVAAAVVGYKVSPPIKPHEPDKSVR